MIIEELTKLDEPKRKTAVVLIVVVAACICYFAITRDSVTKLKAAKASYAGVQAAYIETENQQTDFLNLQKQLKEEEKQFQECQQQCFSNTQAVQFFENINAMALAYNLKPISRVISEPENLGDNKADDENTKPEQQCLKTQSAKITVAGNYFDIADFVKQLTNRQKKICITNLHIALPAGEKFDPKASFKITLVIDLSKDVKK
ncbi:MAG: type 4a pilus biogenesis protein PilO [Sedimentisphaerales bacterium]